MKSWHFILLGILFGLLAAGVILLVVMSNREKAVEHREPMPEAGIAVDVGGAVTNPGVYQLPVGSRVEDAIEAAGGMLPEAYTEIVNMAGPLTDGRKVLVPLKPAESEYGSSTEATVGDSGGLININTADKAALMTLPGIGETKANAIIAYRTENGAFTDPEQLMEVNGIGPGTYDNLKDLITIY
jgi:competence protein ComEA